MDDVCKRSFALDTDGFPGKRRDKSRGYALRLSPCSVTLRSQTIPPKRLVSHVLQATCTLPPDRNLAGTTHLRSRLLVAKVTL